MLRLIALLCHSHKVARLVRVVLRLIRRVLPAFSQFLPQTRFFLIHLIRELLEERPRRFLLFQYPVGITFHCTILLRRLILHYFTVRAIFQDWSWLFDVGYPVCFHILSTLAVVCLVVDQENGVFACELHRLVRLRQQGWHILHPIEMHLRGFCLELWPTLSE